MFRGRFYGHSVHTVGLHVMMLNCCIIVVRRYYKFSYIDLLLRLVPYNVGW